MSDDPWWPGGYDNPAFRVKRVPYGAVEGGDYVRGSDATLDRSTYAPWLPGTAPANLTALKGNATFGDSHYRGPPHTPGQYVLLGDGSAAHVTGRQSYSASGVPTTNNTVWTVGPFPGAAPSPVLPQTAVRYPRVNAVVTEGIGKGLLFARACGVDPAVLGKPNYHVVEVRWGWPTEIEFLWQEVALVRSAFGHPTVPEDGETIFRKLRADTKIDRETDDGTPYTVPAPMVYDYGWIGAGTPSMTSGYWYYYTLFFRINPVDWAAYMSDSVLLPTDYHHSDHLWETVPPFYQWTDDNIAVGSGFLRRFLTIFGYELDHTREYVESVQKAQYADFSPISLLRHVGDNYGLAYEQGLGDIRYRALVANLARLHQIRGTRAGVEELIETGSKYACDVTVGQNVMMLPDDSDFYNGTGNWAPLHPNTALAAGYLTPSVGTVSTGNFAGAQLTGNTTWVTKLRKNVGSSTGAIATKNGVGGNYSWMWEIDTGHDLRLFLGTAAGTGVSTYVVGSVAQINAIPAGVDFYLAATLDTANGVTGYLSYDGRVWTPLLTKPIIPGSTGTFSTSDPIRIGYRPETPAHLFDGRVYWVEQRTGLSPNAGTLTWRYDSNEYPGTGTAYADPRGRTWTLTSASAVTPPPTVIAWGQVAYVNLTTVPTPPLAGGSRGVMRIDSPTTAMQSIMMTCGDGKMPTKDIVPLYSGIPTDVGQTIGFSAWIKAEKNGVVIPTLYLLWFNQSGQPSGIISSSAGGPLGATTAWQQYTMQAVAPTNAIYVVPAIFFESRTGTGAASGRSPFYDVAAVTVYKPGEGGTPVAAVAPDRYLTMGDPVELLGPPKSGFDGYLIGTPGGQS